MKRLGFALVLGACAAVLAQPAAIKIGEINSYSTMPQFTTPYRQGWQLAVEQINAAGGLLGRKVEVISRDDAGKPDEALRQAIELTSSEKVDVLAGGYLSNVGLALADHAAKNKRLYVASEPLTDALVWDKGNRYTFRLRPSTYMQSAMLVEEAAKMPAKRWATIAPNYEYGQSAVATFKAQLKARRPDVEFVAEQWPVLGKLDAGSTLQAVMPSKPDAIPGTRLTARRMRPLPPSISRNSTRTHAWVRWWGIRPCRPFLQRLARPKVWITRSWWLPCAACSS